MKVPTPAAPMGATRISFAGSFALPGRWLKSRWFAAVLSAGVPAAHAQAGWQSVDIGTSTAGTTGESGGVISITGSGRDIWNEADGFRYYYREAGGEFEAIVRVRSLQNTNGWAKAGIMARGTTDPGSVQTLMCVSAEHGTALQWRGGTNALSGSMTPTEDGGPPRWLKLVCRTYLGPASEGEYIITGYVSTDGINWTQAGSRPPSSAPSLVGLAVTSHADGVLTTAQFEQLTLTLPPSPPSNVQVTRREGRIDLAWTDNSTDETGFVIEAMREPRHPDSFQVIGEVGRNVTTFSTAALAPYDGYYFRIKAVNGTVGAYSSKVFALTTPAVSISASSQSPDSITVRITETATNSLVGPSGGPYAIERSTDNVNFIQIASGLTRNGGDELTSICDYIDRTVTPGVPYYYRARYLAPNGDSGAYATLTTPVTTSGSPPASPPAAPSNLVATTVSMSEIRLSWTDNATNESDYQIERSNDGVNFALMYSGRGSNQTGMTDSGLPAGTTYYYRVRAVNAAGPSAYSNIANATTAQPPSTGTWQSQDIGNVARPGSTSEVGGVISIDASGADIWEGADEFRYHYRSWFGDGVITARVPFVENTDGWAKAGVMFRETLAANSRHAIMLISAGHGTAFQYRSATGGAMGTSTPTETQGTWRWLRLVRVGNVFTGYQSIDGVAWSQSGSITLSGMSSDIYVGLAVTSHNDGELCTAQFDNVAVGGSIPAPTGPQVASFTIENTTSAGSELRATYRLVFTESVTGVDATDFMAVNVSGSLELGMAPEIQGVTGSGASYAIAVRAFYNSTSGGQFRLDLKASGTGIVDADGNALSGGASGPVCKSSGGPWPIASVSAPANGTYSTGQVLSFNVNYGVSGMMVTGTPRIALTIGATTRYATYTGPFSGSFGQVLVFQYTVQAGDADADGIAVTSPIELSGGTIRGSNGADGLLTFTPPNTTGVVISGGGGTAPAAPSNLAATAISGTEVRLTWTDNANNETGFEIQRSIGASGAGILARVGSNVTTYADATATPGTNYQYNVRAINGTGVSNFSNTAFVTTPSPSGPWQSLDIGTSTAGSTGVSGGTVTLAGSGRDIWETSDGFRFYYQQETAQDFDAVARVVSITNTNGWAKAGVMFRRSLSASSPFYMMVLSAEHGTAFQRRGPDGAAETTAPSEDGPAPRWLKVSRRGISYTGYVSRDGVNWTQVSGGSNSSNTSTEPMYVGLAVTSHNDGTLCTAVFDNISFTPVATVPRPAAPSNVAANLVSPTEIRVTWADNANNETNFEVHRAIGNGTLALLATVGANVTGYSDTGLAPGTTYTYNVRAINSAGPSNFAFPNATATTPTTAPTWDFRDIGAVGVAGSNTSGTSMIGISASGSDIWDRADAFRFVYRAWTGDGVVEARIASVDNTSDWAKAGVMIRESLDANAKNVFLCVTPSYHGAIAQARSNTGDLTGQTQGPLANAPYWVRLVRTGNDFHRYFSADGVNWIDHGYYIIPMSSTVYFGFAVTSHDNSRLNTAVFSDPFVGAR